VGGDGLTIDVKVGGVSRVSWSGPYGHRLDAETLRVGKVAAGVDVTVELSSAGTHDVDGIMVTFEHVDVGAAVVADPAPVLGPCTSLFPNTEVGSGAVPVVGVVGQTVILTMSAVGSAYDRPDFTVPDGVLRTAFDTGNLSSGQRPRLNVYTVILTQDHLDNGIGCSWVMNVNWTIGALTIHVLPVPGEWDTHLWAGWNSVSTSVALTDADLTLGWAVGNVTSGPSDPLISPDRAEICHAGTGGRARHWWWPAQGTDTIVATGNTAINGLHVRLS